HEGRRGDGIRLLARADRAHRAPRRHRLLAARGRAPRRRRGLRAGRRADRPRVRAGRGDTRLRASVRPARKIVAMRIPLRSGAWLDSLGNWLRSDEADLALPDLRAELQWEQREIVVLGRRILQPRLIAWAGELPYRYSGQTLEPRPFTETARRMLAM